MFLHQYSSLYLNVLPFGVSVFCKTVIDVTAMFNCKLTVLRGVWSHLIHYRAYIMSKEIGKWQWIVGCLTTLSVASDGGMNGE
jgi:hypothetical protein